jgi:hypothetical protein
MVRGRVVVRDSALAGESRIGEHVARQRSPYAVPSSIGRGAAPAK